MDAFGFEWDGPVGYQSSRKDAHAAAVKKLIETGIAYPCGCSRRDLADQPNTELGIRYPGTCRNGTQSTNTALRIRTHNRPIEFDDRLQGTQAHRLDSESGDFVILRKDRLIAYQLAVVVDDDLDEITDVVRGIDLLASTPRQIHVQQSLGLTVPRYAHIPVATNQRGQKLSKSYGAAEILVDRASETLFLALQCLQQTPPEALARETLDTIWAWAMQNWRMDALLELKTIPVGEFPLARAEISQSVSDS